MTHETRNRANAQHSTGPRTAAGKARSSTNAHRHGLCAIGLAPGEDRTERDEFVAAVIDELASDGGTLARELAQHAACAALSLRRASRAEAAALTEPTLRRAVERAGRQEASSRPRGEFEAILASLNGEPAPETPQHKAAARALYEAQEARTDGTADAAAFVKDGALELICRYRTSHERSLARALEALARLKP